MQKIIRTLLVGSLLATCLIIACSKNQQTSDKKTGNLVLTTGKKMDVTINRNQDFIAKYPFDTCQGHGGTVAIGVRWDLATCRSDCTSGIGFRCGRETFVRCNDNTVIVLSQDMGNCPTASLTWLTTSDRVMTATIEFYNNGTAKIIFSEPMISSESSNTTFEMEEDETIEFPEYILIGGNSYTYVKFLENNYEINYEDASCSYGSVVVAVDYIN
jgi:hypothetical protein